MKKILKFFKTHRVFTMLMAIVLVCGIVIFTVLIQCFYVGNGVDNYGDRLKGINEHEISESRISDFKTNLTANDKIKNTEMRIQGKIIYITYQIMEQTSLEEAKSIALKSLENFSEDELGFYDVNITMKENSTSTSDGFIISGYKNKRNNTLVWNNNRQVTSSGTSDPNITEMG